MAAQSWLYWALASAIFAAMTAIFAKLGLQGVDSDFATFYPHAGDYCGVECVFDLVRRSGSRWVV